MENGKWKIKNFFALFCILHFAFCISCVTGSMPNLEKPECTESREAVKKFYSIHFGNEMKFSQENLKLREKFLTPEFLKTLQNVQSENDVFTTDSTDTPRAFRLGGCEIIEPNKTNVEILMFWKNSEEIRQQNIKVEAVKQADKWLINKILR